MGKGKGGVPEISVPCYHMSILYGVCQGPINALTAIHLKEKPVWAGLIRSNASFRLVDEERWGGNNKEGGIGGDVYVQMGGWDQLLSDRVAAMHGDSAENLPGYRGVATVAFAGPYEGEDGYYWGANQPYLPAAWFSVTRLADPDWRPGVNGPKRKRNAVFLTYGDGNGSPPGGNGQTRAAANYAFNTIWDESKELGNSLKLGAQAFSDFGGTLVYQDMFALPESSWAGRKGNTNLHISSAPPDFGLGRQDWEFGVAAPKAFWFDTISESEVNLIGTRTWFVFTSNYGAHPEYNPRPPINLDRILDEDTDLAKIINCYDPESPFNVWDGTAVTIHGFGVAGYTEADGYDVLGAFSATYDYAGRLDNSEEGPSPIWGTNRQPLEDACKQAAAGEYWPPFYEPWRIGPDAGPAHIIRECLTDAVWGMGTPASQIDDASFGAAADALFEEEFGLSMLWTQQSSIESFVQDVLDHIQATLFVHPRTGLFNLKLLRADYNPDGLPILDDSNCKVVDFRRRTPGETVNEIVVTWTNPRNEQEVTVSVQNILAVAQNGGQIVSATRDYHGIRNRKLAKQVAIRDLTEATALLVSAEVEVNRTGWGIVPGDVVKLADPVNEGEYLVMRVGKVSYGTPASPTIKLALMEDVFSKTRPEIEDFPAPESDLVVAPSPRPVKQTRPLTLNYFLATSFIGANNVDDAYPSTGAMVLAWTDRPKTNGYILMAEEVDAAGDSFYARRGQMDLISAASLASDWPFETETMVPASGGLDYKSKSGRKARKLCYGLIGGSGKPDEEMELVQFVKQVDDDWRVKRGVLDTIPRPWPAGTQILIFGTDQALFDLKERSVDELVHYKLRPVTEKGTLREDRAPVVTFRPTDRLYLPTRPGNVKFNGADPSETVLDATALSEITVTWATRNRLEEDSVILSWDAASVAMEAGQTTLLVITDLAGNTLSEIDAGSATSYDVPVGAFSGNSGGFITVIAERDGFRSLMGASQRVEVSTGYGLAWGYDYGGA